MGGRRKRDPEAVAVRKERRALRQRETTRAEAAGALVIELKRSAEGRHFPRILDSDEACAAMQTQGPEWKRFDILRAPAPEGSSLGPRARMVRKVRGQVVWLWAVPENISKPWNPRWRVRLEAGFLWVSLLAMGFERVGAHVPGDVESGGFSEVEEDEGVSENPPIAPPGHPPASGEADSGGA